MCPAVVAVVCGGENTKDELLSSAAMLSSEDYVGFQHELKIDIFKGDRQPTSHIA